MTAAILRAGARTFLSVRKHRNYRLFFTGQVISNIGTWMQRVAQAWLVLSLTHSPFAVGILALCQFMPFTLFSLIAGVVVDRLDAWRTVIGTQLMQMVFASTIAVIALAGVARPWHVYVIAALMGLVQVLDAPSRQQLTFRMVGPLELPNAISLNSGVFNGARIFGPALGGVIIAAAGAGVCFAVNAASYIAVLAGLLMMRPQEFHAVERRARPRTLYVGLKEGISFARNHEQIRLMLMLTFVVSTFCLNFNVLLPVLAKHTLHSGPQVFGLLSAVFGVGALIGALVSAHVSLSAYYNRTGDAEKALAYAHQALELDPQNDAAWFQQAKAQERLSRLDEAVDSLKEAIALNPRSSAHYYVLANLYRRLGKVDESQKALESFKRLEHDASELEKMRRERRKSAAAPGAGG